MYLYTQEPRQKILRSTINSSSSKQAWSFSKQKRFPTESPNCPHVSYGYGPSPSTTYTSFGSSVRKVFTETNEGPSSWMYNPKAMRTTSISFGPGRDEVRANSYILREPLNNPGPGRYSEPKRPRSGYTMRPKTAYQKDYFLNTKETSGVPGPGNYQELTSGISHKTLISKFKSAVLGSSMISKSDRFPMNNNKTPSSWNYRRGDSLNLMGKNKGPKMGTEKRTSFTDKFASNSVTPGPGNYKPPTDFAHYARVTSY